MTTNYRENCVRCGYAYCFCGLQDAEIKKEVDDKYFRYVGRAIEVESPRQQKKRRRKTKIHASDFHKKRRQEEWERIDLTLKLTGGSLKKTAELLGMNNTTLSKRLSKRRKLNAINEWKWKNQDKWDRLKPKWYAKDEKKMIEEKEYERENNGEDDSKSDSRIFTPEKDNGVDE